MREYECVYIANPELTDSQLTELNDRTKTIVEKNDGHFFYARSMGKRRLAYTIAKKNKGIYYCVDFAAGGKTVAELERMYRMNENVMRFLTTVKAEKVDVEARMAEIAARGEDKPAVTETFEQEDKPKERGTSREESAGKEKKAEAEKPAEEKPQADEVAKEEKAKEAEKTEE